MKNAKYLLVCIFIIFGLKSLAPILNLQASNHPIVEQKSVATSDVEDINIDVGNARINIYYSEQNDISVITKLTDYQNHSFHYAVTNNKEDHQLLISQYRENQYINEINTYGEINIIVPNQFELNNLTINCNNGKINSNINAKQLNFIGNSVITNITGNYDIVDFSQIDGHTIFAQANINIFNINQQKGEIELSSLTSEQISISQTLKVELTCNNIYAKDFQATGKFDKIKFENMNDIKYDITSNKVQKTNIDEISNNEISMKIDVGTNDIQAFYVKEE